MNNLAVVYTVLGRFEEALKLHEETLQIRRRLFGPEHPSTLGSMNNLAELLVRQNRLEEAYRLHEETLQMRRRVMGPESPETLQSMMDLANVLRAQERWQEARKLLEQTLELNRRIRPPDYLVRASVFGDLARVLQRLGREEEARKFFEEALQLSRRVNGPNHPDTLLTASNLAWMLATTANRNCAIRPELSLWRNKRFSTYPRMNTTGVSSVRPIALSAIGRTQSRHWKSPKSWPRESWSVKTAFSWPWLIGSWGDRRCEYGIWHPGVTSDR